MTLSSESVYNAQYQLICEDDNMYEDLKAAVSESVENSILIYNDWAAKAEENLETLGLEHTKFKEYSFASWIAYGMSAEDREVLTVEIQQLMYGMTDKQKDEASTLGDFYAQYLEAEGMLETMLSTLRKQ